ncbi:MAG: iron-regulated protein, partial [Myxococcales bacterium]|nr:iron-regulated protein [Myxococcales bacterium]
QDTNPDGAGDRPAADYVSGEDGNPNADRRATYLTTASDLMLTHLGQVRDAWAPGVDGTYRAEWDGLAPEEGLARVMTGMIILAGFETGGERLQTALDSGDQEDEHSCFSDNTHRDMVQDVQGVWNVWHGKYGTDVVGTGVRDVVAEVNDTLAAQLDAEIDASLTAAKALKIPFDKEIASGNSEGNERVQTLIEALRKQEGSLQEVFQLFGLTIPDPE